MANDWNYFMQCVTTQAAASAKRSCTQAQPLVRPGTSNRGKFVTKKFCWLPGRLYWTCLEICVNKPPLNISLWSPESALRLASQSEQQYRTAKPRTRVPLAFSSPFLPPVGRSKCRQRQKPVPWPFQTRWHAVTTVLEWILVFSNSFLLQFLVSSHPP